MKRIRSIGILFVLLLLVLTVGGTSVQGQLADLEICTSEYTEHRIPSYNCPGDGRCGIACVTEECCTGGLCSQTFECWIIYPGP